MALPFHISCKPAGIGLYGLADGRFQLIEDGPIAPLMVGQGYVLAENPLADCLRGLEIERVRFVPAIIRHRRTGEEFRTHERIVVGQRFSHDQINDLNLDGCRLLWLNDQYLFASPELAQRLREGPFSYLHLTKGLTEFAANDI